MTDQPLAPPAWLVTYRGRWHYGGDIRRTTAWYVETEAITVHPALWYVAERNVASKALREMWKAERANTLTEDHRVHGRFEIGALLFAVEIPADAGLSDDDVSW